MAASVLAELKKAGTSDRPPLNAFKWNDLPGFNRDEKVKHPWRHPKYSSWTSGSPSVIENALGSFVFTQRKSPTDALDVHRDWLFIGFNDRDREIPLGGNPDNLAVFEITERNHENILDALGLGETSPNITIEGEYATFATVHEAIAKRSGTTGRDAHEKLLADRISRKWVPSKLDSGKMAEITFRVSKDGSGTVEVGSGGEGVSETFFVLQDLFPQATEKGRKEAMSGGGSGRPTEPAAPSKPTPPREPLKPRQPTPPIEPREGTPVLPAFEPEEEQYSLEDIANLTYSEFQQLQQEAIFIPITTVADERAFRELKEQYGGRLLQSMVNENERLKIAAAQMSGKRGKTPPLWTGTTHIPSTIDATDFADAIAATNLEATNAYPGLEDLFTAARNVKQKVDASRNRRIITGQLEDPDIRSQIDALVDNLRLQDLEITAKAEFDKEEEEKMRVQKEREERERKEREERESREPAIITLKAFGKAIPANNYLKWKTFRVAAEKFLGRDPPWPTLWDEEAYNRAFPEPNLRSVVDVIIPTLYKEYREWVKSNAKQVKAGEGDMGELEAAFDAFKTELETAIANMSNDSVMVNQIQSMLFHEDEENLSEQNAINSLGNVLLSFHESLLAQYESVYKDTMAIIDQMKLTPFNKTALRSFMAVAKQKFETIRPTFDKVITDEIRPVLRRFVAQANANTQAIADVVTSYVDKWEPTLFDALENAVAKYFGELTVTGARTASTEGAPSPKRARMKAAHAKVLAEAGFVPSNSFVRGSLAVSTAVRSGASGRKALNRAFHNVYPAALPAACGKSGKRYAAHESFSPALLAGTPLGDHIARSVAGLRKSGEWDDLAHGRHAQGLVAAVIYCTNAAAALEDDEADPTLEELLGLQQTDLLHAVSEDDAHKLYAFYAKLSDAEKSSHGEYAPFVPQNQTVAAAQSAMSNLTLGGSEHEALQSLIQIMHGHGILLADSRKARELLMQHTGRGTVPGAGLTAVSMCVGFDDYGHLVYPTPKMLSGLQHLPMFNMASAFTAVISLAEKCGVQISQRASTDETIRRIITTAFNADTVNDRERAGGDGTAWVRLLTHIADSLLPSIAGYQESALRVLVEEVLTCNVLLSVEQTSNGRMKLFRGPCDVTGRSNDCLRVHFVGLCVRYNAEQKAIVPAITDTAFDIHLSVCPLLFALYGLRMRTVADHKDHCLSGYVHQWSEDPAASTDKDSADPYAQALAHTLDLDLMSYM